MRERTQKFILSTVGVLVMSILVGYLVFAWTEPTAPPPQENVPAPINVSSSTQTFVDTKTLKVKNDGSGSLIIEGGLGANSLATRYGASFAIYGGNVGIGTTTPASSLHVNSAAISPVTGPYGWAANNWGSSIYAYTSNPLGIDKAYFVIEGVTKELGATSVSGYRIGAHGVLVNSAATDWYLAGSLAQQSGPYNMAYGVVGYVKSCPSGYSCFSGFFGSSGGAYPFVVSSGNVGIGTTSPNSKLTVAGPIESSGWFDNPNKKIFLSSPTGWPGVIAADDAGHRGDIRRVSYGWDFAVHATTTIPPVIMTIHENGNVGIGTTNPQYKLDVSGDVRASHYYCGSDITLKEDIKKIENALEKISQIEGVTFKWRGTEEPGIGLIAQEVEKVFPELVATEKSGLKSIDYSRLTAVLIEAIKEQQGIIREQENKIKELEERILKVENLLKRE